MRIRTTKSDPDKSRPDPQHCYRYRLQFPVFMLLLLTDCWVKVTSCYLVLSLSCEFLKEGKATDDDMRSVASLGTACWIQLLYILQCLQRNQNKIISFCSQNFVIPSLPWDSAYPTLGLNLEKRNLQLPSWSINPIKTISPASPSRFVNAVIIPDKKFTL